MTRIEQMGKLWVGDSNGCWIDVWDKPSYRGNTTRLWGPAEFPYLRLGQPPWGTQIHSLVVGPNAYIQGFEDLNFFDSVFWLLPGQKVQDVKSLSCNDDIDSLRLFDRPPFAHEPGYAAYMLWAASHLSRTGSKGGEGEK